MSVITPKELELRTQKEWEDFLENHSITRKMTPYEECMIALTLHRAGKEKKEIMRRIMVSKDTARQRIASGKMLERLETVDTEDAKSFLLACKEGRILSKNLNKMGQYHRTHLSSGELSEICSMALTLGTDEFVEEMNLHYGANPFIKTKPEREAVREKKKKEENIIPFACKPLSSCEEEEEKKLVRLLFSSRIKVVTQTYGVAIRSQEKKILAREEKTSAIVLTLAQGIFSFGKNAGKTVMLSDAKRLTKNLYIARAELLAGAENLERLKQMYVDTLLEIEDKKPTWLLKEGAMK